MDAEEHFNVHGFCVFNQSPASYNRDLTECTGTLQSFADLFGKEICVILYYVLVNIKFENIAVTYNKLN